MARRDLNFLLVVGPLLLLSGPPLASCQEPSVPGDYHNRRRSAASTATTPGAPRPTPEECESILRAAPSHDAGGSGGLSPQEYSDFLLSRGNDDDRDKGQSQHVDEYGLPTVDFLLRLVGSYNDLACGGGRCGGGEELDLAGLVGGERGERLCGEVYEVLMLGPQAETSPGGGSTLFDHSSEETGEEIEGGGGGGGGEAPEESEDTAADSAEDPQQASVGTQAGDDEPTDAVEEALVRERFDLDVVGSLVDYSQVDPSSSRFGTDHGLSLYLGRHRGDSPLYDQRDAILSHLVSCIGYLRKNATGTGGANDGADGGTNATAGGDGAGDAEIVGGDGGGAAPPASGAVPTCGTAGLLVIVLAAAAV